MAALKRSGRNRLRRSVPAPPIEFPMTETRCASIEYGERLCSQSMVHTSLRSVYGTTTAPVGGRLLPNGFIPGHQPNQLDGRSTLTVPLLATNRRSSIPTVTPPIGVASSLA